MDQLQPTHLDKSRFIVHGYNEPELWYILSSEQRLFGREMFIAGESKPISVSRPLSIKLLLSISRLCLPGYKYGCYCHLKWEAVPFHLGSVAEGKSHFI